MAETITNVKELRRLTGAGFADCKKALEETNNDITAAVKLLKEMGMADAEKRSGRITTEGSIFVAERDNSAVILELGCETDFVAKNSDFQDLGKELALDLLERTPQDIDDPLLQKVKEKIAILKENITLKRYDIVKKSDDEIFACYTHGVPAKLAAIVVMKTESDQARQGKEFKELAFNCSLHAVAKLPIFISPSTISDEYKLEHMDIITKQVEQLGKPENIASGIAQGKWKKHAESICFLTQPWVHDEKTTVAQEIEKIASQLNVSIELSEFRIYILGNN